MIFLLSGEGPSDIGLRGEAAPEEDVWTLEPGPMAYAIDCIVDDLWHYSPIEAFSMLYIDKATLAQRGRALSSVRRPRLPGAERPRDTAYYERNARALAEVAKEVSASRQTDVIAVLFRDADGTNASSRSEWSDKVTSMRRGFDQAGFDLGIPMIPKPKSEAWLLCAVKEDPYQGCAGLEQEPGNDNAPHPLKQQLAEAIGAVATRDCLNQLISENRIDFLRIDMPSFATFRETLTAALQRAD